MERKRRKIKGRDKFSARSENQYREYGGCIITQEKEAKERKKKRKNKTKESKKSEDKQKVKIISWNVAGLGNKKEDFWKYVEGFDIVVLQETWLDQEG